MEQESAVRDFFIQPGYVCFSDGKSRLSVVVSSGVVVTLFDKATGKGGMAHYVLPYRNGADAKPIYAAPAIVALVDMFKKSGSDLTQLEAHLYGGARNPESEFFLEGVAENNVTVGKELLQKIGIQLVSEDTGGNRGRKIVFDVTNGDTIVAKVDRIRATDWYPSGSASVVNP